MLILCRNSGNWTWAFFAPSLLCSLEDVNLKPRCAKTRTRSVCFDELFRHHFLKVEVAFQATCSGGYEIFYPRHWKDSSKAPVLTFVILLWRCCWKMMFCVCNILGFIISPYVCTLSHDLQDSASTFFEQTLSLFTWADLAKKNHSFCNPLGRHQELLPHHEVFFCQGFPFPMRSFWPTCF